MKKTQKQLEAIEKFKEIWGNGKILRQLRRDNPVYHKTIYSNGIKKIYLV